MTRLGHLRSGLVWAALLTPIITVQAQRRPGGGGDDGGGGSPGTNPDDNPVNNNNNNGGNNGIDRGDGVDGGDDDTTTISRDRQSYRTQKVCQPYAQFEDANWVHRWLGSYYNGTIEVTIKMDEAWAGCDAQEREITRTFDGVLSILDRDYAEEETTGSQRNEFIFTLVGWPQGTRQPTLLGSRGDGFLPKATEFYLESNRNFRRDELSGTDTLEDPTCRMTDVTRRGSGYDFTCDYASGSLGADTGRWMMPMDNCDGSRADSLAVQMAPRKPTAPGVRNPAPAEVENMLRGSFGSDDADFRWNGTFRGDFEPFGDAQAGVAWGVDEDLFYGAYEIRFRGSADRVNGYEMNVRNERRVTWKVDQQRLKKAQTCPKSPGGGTANGSGVGSVTVSQMGTLFAAAAGFAAWVFMVVE